MAFFAARATRLHARWYRVLVRAGMDFFPMEGSFFLLKGRVFEKIAKWGFRNFLRGNGFRGKKIGRSHYAFSRAVFEKRIFIT